MDYLCWVFYRKPDNIFVFSIIYCDWDSQVVKSMFHGQQRLFALNPWIIEPRFNDGDDGDARFGLRFGNSGFPKRPRNSYGHRYANETKSCFFDCDLKKDRDDVIRWKHFPCYWPFVRGNHRSPVNSPHKGQWRGALMFSMICISINGWVNNREAGDFRRHHAHYDVTVMLFQIFRQIFYTPTWSDEHWDKYDIYLSAKLCSLSVYILIGISIQDVASMVIWCLRYKRCGVVYYWLLNYLNSLVQGCSIPIAVSPLSHRFTNCTLRNRSANAMFKFLSL